VDWLTSPEAWAGLVALVTLEIVLGIDNVIFTRSSPGGCRRSSAAVPGPWGWPSA
jgi:hypothetical protein